MKGSFCEQPCEKEECVKYECLSHQHPSLPHHCGYILLPRPGLVRPSCCQVPAAVPIPVSSCIWGGMGFGGQGWRTFAAVQRFLEDFSRGFKALTISFSHIAINVLISFNGSVFLNRNGKLCYSTGNHPF